MYLLKLMRILYGTYTTLLSVSHTMHDKQNNDNNSVGDLELPNSSHYPKADKILRGYNLVNYQH
jgi:hypothetical protein